MAEGKGAAWLGAAPEGLGEFVDRLTWHTDVDWAAPDYVDVEGMPDGTDERRTTTDLEQTEAFSSRWVDQPAYADQPELEYHGILLDLDVPAWLTPSSTGGHSHLYVDLPVIAGDLWDFLDAAVKIGLVEEGYVSACKSRGMTSLRAPWVEKGQEPSALRRLAQEQEEAQRIKAEGGALIVCFRDSAVEGPDL